MDDFTKMIYKNNTFTYNLKKSLEGFVFKRRYNYKYQKVDIPHTPIIVVCSCATRDDAKLVSLSFSRPLCFTADASYLERSGVKSDLSKAYTVIPVYPAEQNAAACVQIMRRIKQGYSVCVFPEGKRSADGLTSDFSDSVARLVKKLGVTRIYLNPFLHY